MTEVRSVLALGAHPDDLELGCGATLAKLASSGVCVRAVVFSHGRQGAPEAVDRGSEPGAALASLGIDDVHVHAFPDPRLHEHLNDLIDAMETHFRDTRPDRVY